MAFNLVKAFHDEPMVKIMLVSFLLLILVIAFVLSLHLYAKWYLRLSPPIPAAVLRHVDSSSSGRRLGGVGLDAEVLKSIPVMTYGEEERETGGREEECAVCLSEVTKGERVRLLPKCHHRFHLDCIDLWFESHSTCPLCRDPVAVPTHILAKNERPELNLETGREENVVVFPTNVLFWGNEVHVSTHSVTSTEEENATSSVTVAIDMPTQVVVEDEEQLGIVTTRLRSLKRMLSRDRKINPCSPSHDANQI